MEENYCVYKHTSPSGKVYIGITKQTPNCRWKNGFGYESSPHFWNAIQKYGWENFSHEVLIEGISKEDACAEERRLIADLNALDPTFGYNQKTGGELGSFMNEEAKAKLSDSLKLFYANNPQARKEISRRVTGFRHTDEAKAKMSGAKKGRTFTQTPEWRKHIGEANKAKMQEDPQYYERALARCRENGAMAAKPVVQLDNNENEIARFPNAHEAERKTGIRNGNIGRCCKGYAKSAGGYKWRYANEYNSGREIA